MNRRGFFGALAVLPAAIKKIRLKKPEPPYEWKDLDEARGLTRLPTPSSPSKFLNADGQWIGIKRG